MVTVDRFVVGEFGTHYLKPATDRWTLVSRRDASAVVDRGVHAEVPTIFVGG